MATDVEKVRLLIPDNEAVFDGEYMFTDTEIEAYLEVANRNILRAASYALLAVASSEAIISKIIKTQDLSTNGAAVADALRLTAKQLADRADKEDELAGEFYLNVVDYGVGQNRPELTELEELGLGPEYGAPGWGRGGFGF